jgi:hypothetical protein
MDRETLLASEYGIQIHPETPIYKFQQLSDAAQTKRDERIKAAQEGKIYVG